MKKPVKMQKIDEFCDFLSEHGYSFKYEPTDYDPESWELTVTFPDGMKITLDRMPAFDSTERFVFDKEGYEEYNRNNEKSGGNLPPAAPEHYWNRKAPITIKVTNGVVWDVTEECETVICPVIVDRIANSNFYPGTKQYMAWAEQFTRRYDNTILKLNENYEIIGKESIE